MPDRGAGNAGVVTRREFHRALVQAAARTGRKPVPKPDEHGYRGLKNLAIGELLDGVWIRGQAAEMGIGLRHRGVVRELARLKRAAFKNGAQYRRFLSESHYTRHDVIERVEIQMFSERIQERVVFGIRGQSARNKAFRKFISEYIATWRPRTVCAPGYIDTHCSNNPVL